jgi:hypothetical protein
MTISNILSQLCKIRQIKQKIKIKIKIILINNNNPWLKDLYSNKHNYFNIKIT